MINDHLSDMVSRIKNATMMQHKSVTMPATKLLLAVAEVMKSSNYITSYTHDQSGVGYGTLTLNLAYKDGNSVISAITRVSKPGVRIRRSVHEFKSVLSGMGTAILSTSKGVMSDRQARKQKIGGEVLLELW